MYKIYDGRTHGARSRAVCVCVSMQTIPKRSACSTTNLAAYHPSHFGFHFSTGRARCLCCSHTTCRPHHQKPTRPFAGRAHVTHARSPRAIIIKIARGHMVLFWPGFLECDRNPWAKWSCGYIYHNAAYVYFRRKGFSCVSLRLPNSNSNTHPPIAHRC